MVEEKGAQRAARAGERGNQSDTAVMDNCAHSIEGIEVEVGSSQAARFGMVFSPLRAESSEPGRTKGTDGLSGFNELMNDRNYSVYRLGSSS